MCNERRPVDFVLRRIDQLEDIQITRGRGRPRKIIRESSRKDFEINELDTNMVYDRTLWCNLIYVANLTWGEDMVAVVVDALDCSLILY